MDREKLNKAAEEHSDAIGKDSYCSYTALSSFRQGVDWLMRQPLSDRLTEAEKERFKRLHEESVKRSLDFLEKDPYICANEVGKQQILEMILGKEKL